MLITKRITYYHILGVSSDASDDEILAAFRRRVKEWHPDICTHPDAEERMREINRAAETLCDPERRRRYDLALAGKAAFEKDRPLEPRQPAPGNRSAPVFPARPGRVKPSVPRQARPGTLRFAAVACATIAIVIGMFAVAYYGYCLFTTISPPEEAGNAGALLPVPSPGQSEPQHVTAQYGDELLGKGNYSGALAAYDAVIAENPSVSGRDIWYNRGVALQALGLYSEAAVSFDHALLVSPDDSSVLAQKGAALIGLGRYNESLSCTDEALARTPEIAWIWSNRGIALEHLGDAEGARAAFERAGIPPGSDGAALYRNVILSPGTADIF